MTCGLLEYYLIMEGKYEIKTQDYFLQPNFLEKYPSEKRPKKKQESPESNPEKKRSEYNPEQAFKRYKENLIRELVGMGQDVKSANDAEFELRKSTLKEYLSDYSVNLALGQYLFGDDFNINAEDKRRELQKTIDNEFKKLSAEHIYFQAENPKHFELYKACYLASMFRAVCIEKFELDEVAKRAFKMMGLFAPEPKVMDSCDSENIIKTTLKDANSFMLKHVTSHQPLHDLTNHSLPKGNEIAPNDMSLLKSLLDSLGMDFVKNFSNLPNIISQDSGIIARLLQGKGQAKQIFKEAVMKVKYSRFDENIEMAQIFKQHEAPEEMFNRMLDLMKSGAIKTSENGQEIAQKAVDNIPDIGLIDLENGLYMAKLPASNFRAAILGRITDCCQSVSRDSEEIVIDGINRPNNGFYVFLEAKKGSLNIKNISWDELENTAKIVGQSYVWRGTDGSLTLDSLEVLESHQSKVQPEIIVQALGDKVHALDNAIDRVNLGSGGGTKNLMKNTKGLKETKFPARMIEGEMYGDGKKQYEIYVSKKLMDARDSAKEKFGDNIVSAIASSLAYEEILQGIEDEKYTIEDIKNLAIEDAKNLAIEDAKNLAIEHFSILFSDTAMFLYRTNQTNFQEMRSLLGSDKAKCKNLLLISSKLYQDRPEAFKTLRGFDVSKIKALTSDGVRKLYEYMSDAFDKLCAFDSEKIKALTSDSAMEWYRFNSSAFDRLCGFDVPKIKAFFPCGGAVEFLKRNPDVFDKLCGFDVPKIKALFPPRAPQFYKTNPGAFDKLCGFDVPKIKALVSYSAVEFLKSNPDALDKLCGFDAEKIEALFSYSVFEFLKSNPGAFDKLCGFDVPKIEALFSYSVFEFLKSNPGAFDKLCGFDVEKIKALFSYGAVEFLKSNPDAFDKLCGFDVPKIEALFSYGAVEFLKSNPDAFDKLCGFDVEKIKALFHYGVIPLYESNPGAFDKLCGFDVPKIEALFPYGVIPFYESNLGAFDKLCGFDVPRIKEFFSYGVFEFLKNNPDAFDKLCGFDVEKIKALFHYGVIPLYESNPGVFDKLCEFDVEKIKALFPYGVIPFYESNLGAFDKLCGFDVPKIKALFPCGAVEFLKSNPDVFNRLCELDAEKIKALFPYGDAVEFLKRNPDVFDKLCGFDVPKIKALFPYGVIPLYESNLGAFDKLCGFDVPKIEALFSYGAVEFLKSNPDVFNRLCEFDVPKIKALTSYTAMQFCEKNPDVFNMLCGFDVPKIKALTSYRAMQFCETNPGAFDELCKFDTEKIKALTSCGAFEFLKSNPGAFDRLCAFDDLENIVAFISGASVAPEMLPVGDNGVNFHPEDQVA